MKFIEEPNEQWLRDVDDYFSKLNYKQQYPSTYNGIANIKKKCIIINN